MRFLRIPPPESLRTQVRWFWIMDSEGDLDRPYPYHGMADIHAELIFQYRGEARSTDPSGFSVPRSFLGGPGGTIKAFDCGRRFGMLGAYLYPWAIPALFRIPAGSTVDSFLDVHGLLGREGREAEERILSSADDAERMGHLIRFLEARLLAGTRPHPGLVGTARTLLLGGGEGALPAVAVLADKVGISTRQYERRFRALTGFNPKYFARISRFQLALRQAPKRRGSLSEIGYACGYYDQSHFIRDFKEFSGFHPKTFFFGQAGGTELKTV